MKSEDTQLRNAALRLYFAGCWICPTVDNATAAEMWEQLRDALELPKGSATSRGVHTVSRAKID